VISHQHKCIFVHIQRCGGSTIEAWLCGQNWWTIEPATKHLLASQARKIYAQWWDDYFKFSIVREPVDRMISCLRFAEHFGIRLTFGKRMLLDGYHQRFGEEVVLENDYRFSKREELLTEKHKPGQVYGNLLDEELDFIGRYEEYDRLIEYLGDTLKVAGRPTAIIARSRRRIKAHELAEQSRREICEMFREDIKRFSYQNTIHSN
jgi:Sulfotransferase family